MWVVEAVRVPESSVFCDVVDSAPPAGLAVTGKRLLAASLCPADSTLQRRGGAQAIRGRGHLLLPGSHSAMRRLEGAGLGGRWRSGRSDVPGWSPGVHPRLLDTRQCFPDQLPPVCRLCPVPCLLSRCRDQGGPWASRGVCVLQWGPLWEEQLGWSRRAGLLPGGPGCPPPTLTRDRHRRREFSQNVIQQGLDQIPRFAYKDLCVSSLPLLSGVGQPSIHLQEFITLLLNLKLAAVLIQSENGILRGTLGMRSRAAASKCVSSGPAPGGGPGGSRSLRPRAFRSPLPRAAPGSRRLSEPKSGSSCSQGGSSSDPAGFPLL